MKKIVMGIAAVALATSMFAADPAFDPSVTEFTGNAEVKWGVNLDAEKTGFKNSEEASLKMKLFGGGDKATEGEGVWADLMIKVDDAAWSSNDGLKGAAVDHAKIWIEKFYVGIRAGDILTKEFKPTLALKSDNVLVANNGAKDYSQGIIAGYEDDNLNIGAEFRSNPKADADKEQYTDDYGIAGRVELKDGNEWVNGLGVKVDASTIFEEDAPVAFSAIASYKAAIDDTYYVKPQVGYGTPDLGDDDGTIGAALLFGWGDEADDKPGLYYFNTDDWKKMTPGVSVAYVADVADFDLDQYGSLEVSFFSGDIVENLKAAADVTIAMVKDLDFDKAIGTAAAACQYAIKADDVTVTLKAGIKYDQYAELEAKKAAVADKYDWVDDDDDETTPPVWDLVPGKAAVPAVIGEDLELSVGVDVAGLINNTTFSAEYVSGNLKADPAVKGTINVGCKIAF